MEMEEDESRDVNAITSVLKPASNITATSEAISQICASLKKDETPLLAFEEKSVVERVAIAIYISSNHPDDVGWEKEDEFVRLQVRRDARAAISAMKGANEAMIEAGLEQDTDLGPTEYLEDLWNVMVEAALGV